MCERVCELEEESVHVCIHIYCCVPHNSQGRIMPYQRSPSTTVNTLHPVYTARAVRTNCLSLIKPQTYVHSPHIQPHSISPHIQPHSICIYINGLY